MGNICPICEQSGASFSGGIQGGLVVEAVNCARCGHWCRYVDRVGGEIERSSPELRAGLSAYIRQANEAGERIVEVNADTWRAHAEQHAFAPISKKLDLLLRWYEKQSTYAGAWVPADDFRMYPLVDARHPQEVAFLRETLVAQGLLIERPNKPHYESRLSAEGWARLSPAVGGEPGSCFIAMAFHPSLNDAFENGIVPAVENDCGYRPIRVDRQAHNDAITDRIIAGIRSAQFVVADFTFHRQAVYYEAGFAQGLGRTVVRTCREDHLSSLNFDTRQMFHLKWNEASDLREFLSAHIEATIGRFEGRGR
jgi:hypothetical protein